MENIYHIFSADFGEYWIIVQFELLYIFRRCLHSLSLCDIKVFYYACVWVFMDRIYFLLLIYSQLEAVITGGCHLIVSYGNVFFSKKNRLKFRCDCVRLQWKNCLASFRFLRHIGQWVFFLAIAWWMTKWGKQL